MKIDKQGGMVLMAHLVIFVLILGAYIYTYVTGHPDTDLKSYVGMMLAYWFGAIGKDMVLKKTSKPDDTSKGA